jgi:thymidylate synthase
LAIGELCWHLSGSDDLSAIAYYAPRWREFSDDGSRVVGSCYGKHVFGKNGSEVSQWDRVIQLLAIDPTSRRALLTFHEAPITAHAKDIACATAMQFFVRNNALDAIVYMRSNDVIRGLPYDILLFTMLQELMAATLGVEVGKYYHICGSLHLYERHYRLAEKIVTSSELSEFEMPPMYNID